MLNTTSDAINAEVIRQIESCLYIVCLDDSPQARSNTLTEISVIPL